MNYVEVLMIIISGKWWGDTISFKTNSSFVANIFYNKIFFYHRIIPSYFVATLYVRLWVLVKYVNVCAIGMTKVHVHILLWLGSYRNLVVQWWDAESRQTALYLVNGWDLRPALWRASCWPFLRNILLKKFLDQSNFIAHFCKKCEIPLYSPFFLGFATESRHPFFAQKYWF